MYVCMYMYVYICVCVYMCVFVYVCIYKYICVCGCWCVASHQILAIPWRRGRHIDASPSFFLILKFFVFSIKILKGSVFCFICLDLVPLLSGSLHGDLNPGSVLRFLHLFFQPPQYLAFVGNTLRLPPWSLPLLLIPLVVIPIWRCCLPPRLINDRWSHLKPSIDGTFSSLGFVFKVLTPRL